VELVKFLEKNQRL
jgi:hypothetical protein